LTSQEKPDLIYTGGEKSLPLGEQRDRAPFWLFGEALCGDRRKGPGKKSITGVGLPPGAARKTALGIGGGKEGTVAKKTGPRRALEIKKKRGEAGKWKRTTGLSRRAGKKGLTGNPVSSKRGVF